MDVKFEKLCQALVEAEVPLERSDQSVPGFFCVFFLRGRCAWISTEKTGCLFWIEKDSSFRNDHKNVG